VSTSAFDEAFDFNAFDLDTTGADVDLSDTTVTTCAVSDVLLTTCTVSDALADGTLTP
jgi:hypothetical protein